MVPFFGKNRTLHLQFLVLALIILVSPGCGKKEKEEEEKVTLKIRGEEITLAEIEPKEVKGTPAVSEGEFTEFVVYRDKRYKGNHYIPSGWMGDRGDIGLNENWMDNPYSDRTCIKITYSGECSQNAGWTGIYWQNPANNWGFAKGGFDLTGAKRLSFWARGEKGGEVIAEFKMGGIGGDYPDSDSSSLGPIELTDSWQQYIIDLEGMDLSYISGGFCWVISKIYNPDGCTFYLDEIKYE